MALHSGVCPRESDSALVRGLTARAAAAGEERTVASEESIPTWTWCACGSRRAMGAADPMERIVSRLQDLEDSSAPSTGSWSSRAASAATRGNTASSDEPPHGIGTRDEHNQRHRVNSTETHAARQDGESTGGAGTGRTSEERTSLVVPPIQAIIGRSRSMLSDRIVAAHAPSSRCGTEQIERAHRTTALPSGEYAVGLDATSIPSISNTASLLLIISCA
jgi:hypothetical protein